MPAEGMRRGTRSQVDASRRSSRDVATPQIAVGTIADDRASDAAADATGADGEMESSTHADSLRLAVVAEPRTAARRRSERRPAIIHLRPLLPAAWCGLPAGIERAARLRRPVSRSS